MAGLPRKDLLHHRNLPHVLCVGTKLKPFAFNAQRGTQRIVQVPWQMAPSGQNPWLMRAVQEHTSLILDKGFDMLDPNLTQFGPRRMQNLWQLYRKAPHERLTRRPMFTGNAIHM